MNFSDSFFSKIEKKTNVDKNTILDLAKKLQQNDMKNENTLREVIQELGKMTGKEVSKEKEDKIISAVINDKVPKDIDKFIWWVKYSFIQSVDKPQLQNDWGLSTYWVTYCLKTMILRILIMWIYLHQIHC